MLPLLIFLISAIIHVQSNPVATLFKCPSGTNDCVKNAAIDIYELMVQPNPDLGIEEIDPLFQELIEEDLEIIKYKLINSTITGFKSCRVQEATLDKETKTVQLEFLCQKFDMQGQYDVKGVLLTMPVEGNGDYSLLTGKYKLVLDFNLERISKNGKTYATIKSFSFKADPLERLTYNLTNLFGGNEELAQKFLHFVNDNWKPAAYVLQDPTLRANLKKIVQNGNKLFKSQPID